MINYFKIKLNIQKTRQIITTKTIETNSTGISNKLLFIFLITRLFIVHSVVYFNVICYSLLNF